MLTRDHKGSMTSELSWDTITGSASVVATLGHTKVQIPLTVAPTQIAHCGCIRRKNSRCALAVVIWHTMELNA